MFYIMIYFILAALIMIISHIYFSKTYTFYELLAQSLATFVAIVLITFTVHSLAVKDYKIIHGIVESKEFIQKSCRMSWQSYPDSWCEHHWTKEVSKTVKRDGKNVIEYETYYMPKYSWERKYYVHTTIGKYRIDSIDEQGYRIPPRYEIVMRNDPVSKYDYYNNYIGAASHSLFKYDNDSFPDLNIERTEIYDYYNIDQVYFDGVQPNISNKAINRQVSILNSKLTNDANVVLYITDKPESIADSLQVKWNGFKINDIVIILGVDKDNKKYEYAKVFSWSESSMVEIALKDFFLNSNYSDLDNSMNEILKIVENNYQKSNPEKYKYLMAQIGLPLYGHILLILIIMVLTPLITFFLAKD